MTATDASTMICFNTKCGASVTEGWRRGWSLRSGDVARLCNRCGCAYAEVRFCEDFHSDATGWRNCEACGKRLHCGCIASIHALLLLDAGGVECIACAKKNMPNVESNQLKPPTWSPSLSLFDGLADQSVKACGHISVTNSVNGQREEILCPPGSLAWQHESFSRTKHPDTEQARNKVLHTEHPSSCFMENMNLEDLLEKEADGSLKLSHRTNSINSEADNSLGVPVQEYMLNLKDSGHVEVRKIQEAGRDTSIDELEVKKYTNGLKHDPPGSGHNVTPQLTSLKDDSSNVPGLSMSFQQQCVTSDSSKPDGSHVQQQGPLNLLPNQYSPILRAGLLTSKETQNHISIARNHGEGRPRNQTILSRYWPRVKHQELQQISGDSNSVIIPLFEKTLSASDAGRIGRLVLPKKCAETYLPMISHPEGLPLKIQDANGKEWLFQFRFWPNNNSRMYVLEGVTSCIQSMQLQAGDIVTFSRIDPEGKLLMGFRKASSVISDQNIQLVENPQDGGEISTRIAGLNEVVTALPAYSSKGTVEPVYDSSSKQIQSVDAFSVEKAVGVPKSSLPILLDRKKSRNAGSRSRRLSVDINESMKLKLTWDEAQGYLQPPPNYSPTVVVIGGHEFEEYEEPPILGKQAPITGSKTGERTQWVQCVDCSKWRKLPADACLPPRWVCSDNIWNPERSSCSSAQEISMEQLEERPSKFAQKGSRVGKKRKRKETLTKLDELADLAILDGNEAHPPTHPPTTKHPRHRDGCSCIVCIQPPSGQGPKHEPSCTCNVCLTVKRRFRTLMLRRKKRQSEKDAENAQRNHQESPEKVEFVMADSEKPVDNPCERASDVSIKASDNGESLLCSVEKGKGPNVGKGQIDLNVHPEDFSPHSDLASTIKPFHDSMWMGVQCSSRDQERQTNVNAVDPDDKSKVANDDVHEPRLRDTDITGSEATRFSNPAPTPETYAA